MCRLTAQLDRAFIHRYLKQVKSGASGVVWLRLDPALPWPTTLNVTGAVSAQSMLWLRRVLCGWRGHEQVIHIAATSVTAVCIRCGHESPGWHVRPRKFPK